MARSLGAAAIAAGAALLSGCGDYLGDYQLERIRLVEHPPKSIRPAEGVSSPYPKYLEVELSSETNLNIPDTGPGLYVGADYCPLGDDWRLVAFGPVDLKGDEVGVGRAAAQLHRDAKDGRYHYLIYLVPRASERTGAAAGERRADYDLVKDARDVCVRFHAPGYNIIPSRSAVARIPASAIQAALAQRT